MRTVPRPMCFVTLLLAMFFVSQGANAESSSRIPVAGAAMASAQGGDVTGTEPDQKMDEGGSTAPDLEVVRKGLLDLSAEASILGQAYQLRRESLWWSNLFTLVLPALLTTLVAIMAAAAKPTEKKIAGLPLPSFLAGSAALLVTVHTAFNCEEYQAECLRLSGLYTSISMEAKYAGRASENLEGDLARLSDKLASVTEGAAATVPRKFLTKAEEVLAERAATRFGK